MVRTDPVSIRGPARDHRAASNFAFIGALLFVISALLYIDGIAIENSARVNAPGGMDAYKQLNVTNLQALWAGRRAAQGAILSAEFTGALAWFSLMPPVAAFTAQLGGSSRSANGIVTSCFNGVALITLVDLTFQAGTISLVDWISSWDIIQGATEQHARDGGFGALQSLEIAFMVGQSRTVWLFAMDEMLLTIGLATCAFLVYTARGHSAPFASGFAHLSVVIAFVALVGFIFHVARLFSWRAMMTATAVATGLVYLVLLPVWLVWLGVQLRNRSEEVAYSKNVEMPRDDVEMASPARQQPVGGVITSDVAERA